MDSEIVGSGEKQLERDAHPLPEMVDWEDVGLNEDDLYYITNGTTGVESSNLPRTTVKKVSHVGRNWLMALYEAEENLDMERVLNGNSMRFKYAIWQYVLFKGRLSIQAYIEGKENMTLGTMRKLFSPKAHFKPRRCTREQEEGRVRGPYTFGQLNQGSRNRTSPQITSMVSQLDGGDPWEWMVKGIGSGDVE